MNRRQFVQASSLVVSAACLRRLPAAAGVAAGYWPATVAEGAAQPLTHGRREPFGWRTAALGSEPLRLTWPETQAGVGADRVQRLAGPTRLRLAAALDARDEQLVQASLTRSEHVLGRFEIRFASQFQLYELVLSAADAQAAVTAGVSLRQLDGSPLRVFTGQGGPPDELRPHLLLPGTLTPSEEFELRLRDLGCIQPFGWMEGCVLDGLLDWGDVAGHEALLATARRHLGLFVSGDRLTYEGPTSQPCDGRIYGIEGLLPWAALARLQPDSPLLELAVTFARLHRDQAGAVIDGGTTTSEGAYTVGYPLAVMANQRQDEGLAQSALAQLSTRQARLFDGRTFCRTLDRQGARGNRLWARGIAWELLGMARTLRELRARRDLAEPIASFGLLAAWIQRYQRPDGLWSVFVDEPALPADTAGSAGIAAALAIGAQQGWLDETARKAAWRCRHALTASLTPDGFLGGASQSNKGGEALQRGAYRVIYQMASGLLAQLIAALPGESGPPPPP